MGALTGEQYGELQEALLDAFPTHARLEEMLMVRRGKSLDQIVMGGSMREVAFELIKAAEAEGWTPKLVASARESNPGNPRLAEVASELHLAVQAPPRRDLERLIDEAQGMLEPVQWRERLGWLETQVCQLEYRVGHGTVKGTGFLVGPDRVMTNYHVVAPIIERKADAAGVRARFDFKKLSDGQTVNRGVEFELADDWCIDSSPYSPVDELIDPGDRVPDADELDYAVLRLDEAAGDKPVGENPEPGAPARGWIARGSDALSAEGLVFVLQHPEGRPLQLAIDKVIGENSNGTRLRYRTNTEGGSSGSPCFDINLNLAALHHSGDPNFAPTHHAEYNEGIPLPAIVGLLEERNLLDSVFEAKE